MKTKHHNHEHQHYHNHSHDHKHSNKCVKCCENKNNDNSKLNSENECCSDEIWNECDDGPATCCHKNIDNSTNKSKIHKHESTHSHGVKILNPFKNLDSNKIKEDGHSSSIKWKLVVGLLAFILSIAISFSPIDNSAKQWTLFSIATFSLLTVGLEYFISTYYSIKYRHFEDDLLVTISISIAYIYSCVMAFYFRDPNVLFFEFVGEILGLMYVGKFLEGYLSKKASKEIEILQQMFPTTAIKIVDGKEIEIEAKNIKVGDLILVKMGSKVPVDGIVIEGITTTNDSTFTGESLPQTKDKDAIVYCGTISITGTILFKATSTLQNSMIGKIIEGINQVSQAKPKTQRVADKIARWFLPTILSVMLISLLSWGFSTGDWTLAFEIAITILVIACPSSFALVTPLSVLFSTGVGTKRGIHFNSKDIFEKTKNIDAICFDKTGTLTLGELNINQFTIPKEYLSLIKSIESKSNHPIAKSIVSYLKSEKLIDNFKFKEIAGKGFEINFNNQEYYLGSWNFIHSKFSNLKEDEKNIKLKKQGNTIIYFATKKIIYGFISLADKIKDDAKETIAKFKQLGIQVFMITGDNKDTASYIASQLEIEQENVFSEVDPLQKAAKIRDLKSRNLKVAFVGDGVNDSVALKESDFGIAMNSGTDIAKESADVIIRGHNLSSTLDSILLSKRTMKTIYRGFMFSIFYNVILIPLALTGLLNPVIALLAQLVSDSLTPLNAWTLRRYIKKDLFEHFNKKNKK